MKTAVEWLENEIKKLNIPVDGEKQSMAITIIEQANKMFEEQIKDAYEVGRMRGMNYDEKIYYERNWSSNEQYYNKTFKSE